MSWGSRIKLEGDGYSVTKEITGSQSILGIDVIRRTLVEGLCDSVELLLYERSSDELKGLRGQGVYVGKAGVALALGKVLEQFRGSLAEQYLPPTFLDRVRRVFDGLLQELRSSTSRREATFLEGQSGILAVLARFTNEVEYYDALLSLAPAVVALKASECELLYGRSGYLYSLLYVRDTLPPRYAERYNDILTRVVKQIAVQGYAFAKQHNEWAKQHGAPTFTLLYEWHGKIYFGAAHGVSGIMGILLQVPHDILASADPLLPAAIQSTVKQLAALQLPSGNYPSSQGSTSGRLNQFCHGSTGFVLMFERAYRTVKDAQYLVLAESAGRYLKANIQMKGVGLCHGVSGNVFPFLSLYQSTGEVAWLQTAVHLAMFLSHEHSRLYQQSDSSLSLFEGVAGMVCLLTDLLTAPSCAQFPGFDVN